MADKIKIDFADRQNIADIIKSVHYYEGVDVDTIIDKIITYLNSIQ